jgi:hypothetical protein
MPVGSQRFDEAVLDDIFGQMVIAQALSCECHEHLEILENCIFNASHRGEGSSGAMGRKQGLLDWWMDHAKRTGYLESCCTVRSSPKGRRGTQ